MLSLQIMFCFTPLCQVRNRVRPVCPGPLPLILGKIHRSRKIRKGKQNKTAPSFVAQGLDPPLIPDILVADTKSVAWSKKTNWADNLLCMLDETFFKNGENWKAQAITNEHAFSNGWKVTQKVFRCLQTVILRSVLQSYGTNRAPPDISCMSDPKTFDRRLSIAWPYST